MEWMLTFVLIFGGLLALMVIGFPVAFSFILIDLIAMVWLWGDAGIGQFILSVRDSVSTFLLVPVPLFIIMGELTMQSGVVSHMIDAVDQWIGKVPGRLGIISIVVSALFAMLTGVTMASVAILGRTLLPEMEKRGYKSEISIGTIVGGGCLANLIPPTILGIVFGALGSISIGGILTGILIPGAILSLFFIVYVLIKCYLHPSIAPPYSVPPTRVLHKIRDSIKYLFPIGFILFSVVGVIIFGIATPSEAASTGTVACFLLVASYKRLSWGIVKRTFRSSLEMTTMILMIIIGARAFGQVLIFSGAVDNFVKFVGEMGLSSFAIMIIIQVVLFILGMFMELTSVIMVSIPIFMPLVNSVGIDPIWFAVVSLTTITIGAISPPFGLNLFTFKGVTEGSYSFEEIVRSTLPYVFCMIIMVVILIVFPQISLWLPELSETLSMK